MPTSRNSNDVDYGNGLHALAVSNVDGSGQPITGGVPAAWSDTAVNNGSSITADQDAVKAATTGLRFGGFSVMEDAGAPASFRIVHGITGAAGTLGELISLNANESTGDSEIGGSAGVDYATGLSIDWVSGSFKLSIKTKVVT